MNPAIAIAIAAGAMSAYAADQDVNTSRPYFYEYDGSIINLSQAREFYVDHLPMTNYYWPKVKIGISSYTLSPALGSHEEAMSFIRELMKNIDSHQRTTEEKQP